MLKWWNYANDTGASGDTPNGGQIQGGMDGHIQT